MRTLLLTIIFTTGIFVANSQTSVTDAFSKSYTYETNQEYTKAIATLTAVYDATSYTINLRLGWLNYLAGEYTKSQNYYKKAIELEPNSIEARMGYVSPTSAMQNWDDVVKTYSSILTLDPNNSTVNYRMAYIHFVRKEFEKAAAYAEKVVKLYPFDYDANYLLGQIEVSQGKIKEAKTHLNRALEYNPSSTEVKSLLEKI